MRNLRLAGCVLVALALLAAPAAAATPGENGRLVFVSEDDVFTMNPDGSERTRIFTGWSR